MKLEVTCMSVLSTPGTDAICLAIDEHAVTDVVC